RARIKDGDETPLLPAARAGAVNIDMGVGMLAAVRQTDPGREHQRRTAVALTRRHREDVGPGAAAGRANQHPGLLSRFAPYLMNDRITDDRYRQLLPPRTAIV